MLLFEVSSDSMYPVCKRGDGVLAVRTPFEKLKEGDLITFYQSGQLVTHEIKSVDAENRTVTTYSIVTGMSDTPITEEDYIGRAVKILPWLSVVLGLIKGPFRKAAWILVILLIFFGPDVIIRLAEKRKTKKARKAASVEEPETASESAKAPADETKERTQPETAAETPETATGETPETTEENPETDSEEIEDAEETAEEAE